MANPTKSKAAKIQDSIRQVQYSDWSPIPVSDLPEDEYDKYNAPVYRILMSSRAEDDLIECLF